MLREVLRPEGFLVFSAMTYDIRDSRVDFNAFLELHNPSVVVYDVAPPYEANWQLFQHLRNIPAAKNLPFVITSTNAAQVRLLAGADFGVHEVIGKPYDLALIVEAVKAARFSRGE